MRKERVPAAVPLDAYFRRRLRDPKTAAAYLNAAIGENEPAAFLQALREVAEAQGGVASVAGTAGLNRQQLYRTLSAAGNPELRSLVRILGAAGLGFAVTPITDGVRGSASVRARLRRVAPRAGNARKAARAP